MYTEQLKAMFLAAVAAVDPADSVEASLRNRRLDATVGPVTVLALGKAAAGMVRGAHRVFGNQLAGVAVLPEAADLPAGVTALVGSHPIPDGASVVAGEALIAAADRVPADSLVICLISGGGSALAEVPVSGVTIGDLATVNRLLLESGAAIEEVNAVRRRLSQLKGGGLASHIVSPRLLTLAISDVGAAGSETIASGPTVASVSGPSPLRVLEAYRLADAVPAGVVTAIESAVPTTGPITEVEVIADGAVAAAAAVAEAARMGLTSWHSDRLLAGEASDEACRVIDDARRRAVDVVVHTGETTVAVTGGGVGGRNHEAALAAAIRLDGYTGTFLAAGTDGVDGNTDGAGAVVDAATAATARELGVDPQAYLTRNDSGTFFDKVPGRIVTGPTGTNVADIWLVAPGTS